MALSLSTPFADVGTIHAEQTDATATADTLKGSSGTLHKVEIDNTANTAAVFVKMWDTVGGVTVGTTAPSYAFKCAASSLRVYSCPRGAAFTAGLKVACVTDGGGTAGTTSPTNDVIYRILLS